MSAAQKATAQSGKDRDKDPKPGTTASARKSAGEEDLPRLGEKGGRFYMRFRIAGEGDIPQSTHDDCAVEVRLFATNDKWVPTSEDYTVESDDVVDGMHEVLYSIPVELNLTREGKERAKDREKQDKRDAAAEKREQSKAAKS